MPQPLAETLTSAVPIAEEGATAAASSATQAGLFSSVGSPLYLKDLIKPIPQHGKFVLWLYRMKILTPDHLLAAQRDVPPTENSTDGAAKPEEDEATPNKEKR